jgi:tRNA A37 threonylcarbamoyltransferase TsaD
VALTWHIREDINSIFDPIMTDILKLACKQRNGAMKSKQKKPKAIFLVGGLGGNQLLHERLKAEFSTGDIDVIQPRGPNV